MRACRTAILVTKALEHEGGGLDSARQGQDIERQPTNELHRPHSSISRRENHRIIGYTIAVTAMNRITFPAVASPKNPA